MARDDRKFNPFGEQERLTGHGEVSEGLPPRQTGDTPGYGVHGMGYAHGTGSFGGMSARNVFARADRAGSVPKRT